MKNSTLFGCRLEIVCGKIPKLEREVYKHSFTEIQPSSNGNFLEERLKRYFGKRSLNLGFLINNLKCNYRKLLSRPFCIRNSDLMFISSSVPGIVFKN